MMACSESRRTMSSSFSGRICLERGSMKENERRVQNLLDASIKDG